MATQSVERFDTVIVGGGQAGLATGYHLAKRNASFVILDASERIGDPWRNRWDSLRLYSPARYDGLPGMPYPGRRSAFPTTHEMADFLESYASHFELPVRTSTAVDTLARNGERYVVTAGAKTYEADNVVVATGVMQKPVVPRFAPELDPSITQLHSSDYRNPSQLQEGPYWWSARVTRVPTSRTRQLPSTRRSCREETQARSLRRSRPGAGGPVSACSSSWAHTC